MGGFSFKHMFSGEVHVTTEMDNHLGTGDTVDGVDDLLVTGNVLVGVEPEHGCLSKSFGSHSCVLDDNILQPPSE